MKRFSKILTLVLVVVFLFSIFAGCDLIGKDTGKYRAATAITVGNQTITVGKLLDTFNSYYNQYYFYVYYSGWTLDDIFDLAVQSLYTQYMKVEAYTGNSDNIQVAANKGSFVNAEYLSQAQLDYSISYVKYLFFNSFDSTVMGKIEAKYDLKDEETEDTSRDFYKYDDLDLAEGENYANYYFNQNFKDEEMDEYIETYYGGDNSGFISHKVDADSLQALYLQTAEKKAEEIYARIDVDEDAEEDLIELDDFIKEYKDYQIAAVSQFKSNVKNNYAVDFDKFVTTQIEDMIVSAIVNLYNYNVYKVIEGDNRDKTNELLQNNYDTLVANQKAKYNDDISQYVKFIEGLTDSSFIYYVPDGHEEDYVFVKNILIPFNDAQTAKLNSLASDLGTSDDDRYIALRDKLATEIVADDYNSEKNDDGEYEKIEKNPFILQDGKVIVNPECEELSAYLKDGNVTAMEKDGKTLSELDTVKELMARFNTDVGQHSSYYSYVVRVGDGGNEVSKDYTHRWVQEFVDATNEAMAIGDGIGHYGIGVSDYGVHIVYVEKYVQADIVNLENNNYLDTTTTEYRLFKNYFNTQVNLLLSKDMDALKNNYKDDVKITKVFDKFLKENGLAYDLLAKLAGDND